MADALRDGPTFVLFSGGRDSSAVLAVATHVARREQLPLPVPVTAVFPGAAETDESAWQDLVLAHLGLRDRIVVTVRDEHRWLGDEARASLLSRGILWPPSLHLQDVVLRHVGAGHLLTGEGGDEVLGARRVTAAALLVRDHVRPTRPIVSMAARHAVPTPVRSLGVRAEEYLRPTYPWLRGEAARAATAARTDELRSPWSWSAATRSLLIRRAPAVADHNYARIATEHDLRLHHPLRSPGFVHALANEGGFWGYQGRTHLMRVLFADLLPDRLLTRSTKAFFDATRFGPEEREFAHGWTGEGVDPMLVDPARLRAHWLGENPRSATAVLLHQAWLASMSPAGPAVARGASLGPGLGNRLPTRAVEQIDVGG